MTDKTWAQYEWALIWSMIGKIVSHQEKNKVLRDVGKDIYNLLNCSKDKFHLLVRLRVSIN